VADLSSIPFYVILSIAVAMCSITISKEKIFRSIRNRIIMESDFFGDLIVCPYCLSFYISTIFFVIWPNFHSIREALFYWLVLVSFSRAMISILIKLKQQ
jgi:hypothetical protein